MKFQLIYYYFQITYVLDVIEFKRIFMIQCPIKVGFLHSMNEGDIQEKINI